METHKFVNISCKCLVRFTYTLKGFYRAPIGSTLLCCDWLFGGVGVTSSQTYFECVHWLSIDNNRGFQITPGKIKENNRRMIFT